MNCSTLASKAPTEFESKHLITIDPELEVPAVNFKITCASDWTTGIKNSRSEAHLNPFSSAPADRRSLFEISMLQFDGTKTSYVLSKSLDVKVPVQHARFNT
ncbi:hypothetical protein PSCFBP3800_01279 [Pseudomonas syringae group genomosp. 3]|uniref:Uncharacterized protein n=1 Tax=Pseudomonas syringae group genomosp. 3 TaxID=251701 RepID=A0A2K4W8W3_9PSED|nr:hypothetical protein CFBP6411_00971 [Pseudomonas syringae group genomosp. 3]SPF11326.1 hypothetical protein PSCFBP3800_01279 [Pseudomonas syringae group genomosp. 3]